MAAIYGYAHRRLREELLAAFTPGQPCARCGRPMWGPASKIHLGHDHVNGGYLGLEHEKCNEADGARRGNRMRGRLSASRRPPQRSRW